MKDLSMHILDIAMNSIKANASLVEITVKEKKQDDVLVLIIEDNGHGMDETAIKQVLNPFYTTRTTRRVGFGLPLLAQNVELTNGTIEIKSRPGDGTKVICQFGYSHIDRVPLGNINETITSLIMMEPSLNFRYIHEVNEQTYVLDTREIKQVLGEVPINEPSVIEWLKGDLEDQF